MPIDSFMRFYQLLIEIMYLSSHVKLRRLIIITRDEERRTTLPNGQEVEIIPVWKWLLSN